MQRTGQGILRNNSRRVAARSRDLLYASVSGRQRSLCLVTCFALLLIFAAAPLLTSHTKSYTTTSGSLKAGVGPPPFNATLCQERAGTSALSTVGGGLGLQNWTSAWKRGNAVGKEDEAGSVQGRLWSCGSTRPEGCPKEAKDRKEPCVYGLGFCRAVVMEPAHFFIEPQSRGVLCYVRTTGAGVMMPDITHVAPGVLRVDYTPQQEGEFLWWIMCSNLFAVDRPWPEEASVMPWFHNQLSADSPSPLIVESSPHAPPRGCNSCTGPAIGTMHAQWVRLSILRCQCGIEAVGAVERWFWDDYVWAPRACLFPFRKRDEFSRHMAGARIALVGDSTVRGTYADIVNWLNGVGPETLQAPGYSFDAVSGESSWDGIVAGFNPPPLQWEAGTILPNPVEAPREEASPHPPPLVQHWGTYEARSWPNTISQVLRGDFDAVVLNFGLWLHTLPQVVEEGRSEPPSVAEFVKRLVDMLLCKPQHRERLGCSGRFGGRIIYRTAMGKFDPYNFCNRGATGVRVRQGEVCEHHDEVLRMLKREFSMGSDGDIVLLDAFNITFSRPDRSLDSFHFSPRKCSKAGHPCGESEARSIMGCCWEANRFPSSASLSHTNVLINMLWNDPIVLMHARHRLQTSNL